MNKNYKCLADKIVIMTNCIITKVHVYFFMLKCNLMPKEKGMCVVRSKKFFTTSTRNAHDANFRMLSIFHF